MKFGIFALSTVPGTLAERERLRPIGRNNERVQQMFEELRAIAIRADQSDDSRRSRKARLPEGSGGPIAPMAQISSSGKTGRRILL
jgi:hypothetical protein